MLRVALVIVLLAALAQDAPPRRRFVHMLSEHRAEDGLRRLRFDADLSRYARRHSQVMRKAGELVHSSSEQLRRVIDGRVWKIAGEVVGVGGSVFGIFRALLASDAHALILHEPQYRAAAVGIVRDDRVWLTCILYG